TRFSRDWSSDVCSSDLRVRGSCGLALYGDLQVGYSDADTWRHMGVFLRGYLLGAPPSRTNPEGQPWGYPVLDPAQYGGAARELRSEERRVGEGGRWQGR